MDKYKSPPSIPQLFFKKKKEEKNPHFLCSILCFLVRIRRISGWVSPSVSRDFLFFLFEFEAVLFWGSSISPPMACSLKTGISVSRLKDHSRLKGSKQKKGFPVLRVDFLGKSVGISDRNGVRNSNPKAPNGPMTVSVNARVLRWWEKALKPNMVEIHSAQQLVDALIDAGDRLAIVVFYSPGCGGCKALHPKICQLAELNPDAIFLKVNIEELRTMCKALGICVLPFFRFYRGAEGRVSSFSCTNSTIKKFKDALAKHGTDRCSILPVKGLDESELERLAKAGEISLDSPPSSCLMEGILKNLYSYGSWGTSGYKWELLEENNLILKV